MHRRLGSATMSQLAFPGEANPNFPWEKSHWGNTIVKSIYKKVLKKKRCKCRVFFDDGVDSDGDNDDGCDGDDDHNNGRYFVLFDYRDDDDDDDDGCN